VAAGPRRSADCTYPGQPEKNAVAPCAGLSSCARSIEVNITMSWGQDSAGCEARPRPPPGTVSGVLRAL